MRRYRIRHQAGRDAQFIRERTLMKIRYRAVAAASAVAISAAMGLAIAAAAPAQASTGYSICDEYGGGWCINSPGVGNPVVTLSSKFASFKAINATKWDGHDVAEQQVGAGPDCLEAYAGFVYVFKCSKGDTYQEWWWDQSSDNMVNVGLSGSSGDECMTAVSLENGSNVSLDYCANIAQDGWVSNDGVQGP
jgi:hypothetical protein